MCNILGLLCIDWENLPSTVKNSTIKQGENKYLKYNTSIGNLLSSYLLF